MGSAGAAVGDDFVDLGFGEIPEVSDGKAFLSEDLVIKGGAGGGERGRFALDQGLDFVLGAEKVGAASEDDFGLALGGAGEFAKVADGDVPGGLGGHFVEGVKDQDEAALFEQVENGIGVDQLAKLALEVLVLILMALGIMLH